MAKAKRPTAESAAKKKPFDIAEAIRKLRKAVAPYPKAAMFELAARGHDSILELLVACIISIRTRDEVSLPTALRLFAAAPTPADLVALSDDEIDELIATSAFHEAKARTIRAI